jgi:hypothetical protein
LSISLPSDRSGEYGAVVAAEASRFRALLQQESRSASLSQLFDYLLERSADGRAPKEIEIAMAVFGKSATFDTSQDSMVRGHVHRLRQRLDSFNAGKSGPRLQIPKGEYRLVLSQGGEEMAPAPGPVPDAPRDGAWRTIAILLVASALCWVGLFLFSQAERGPSSLGRTSFWRPVAAQQRLPLVAAGDFYLVVESGPDGKVRRLAMHPMIQSGRDLDIYLTMHPGEFSTLHDRDVHRVPVGVATGAAAILPLVSAMRADHDVPQIVPVSQLSQDAIDSNNVIYIEYFAQLGLLRSPILQMSGFAPGQSFDELKDIPSGKLFTARPAPPGKASSPGRPALLAYGYDYGYIASYPEPSGNRVLIISGIEDVALSQMAKLVSDKRQLDLLARQLRGADAFEALYQVRSVGGLIFDTTLLIARPLNPDRPSPSPH